LNTRLRLICIPHAGAGASAYRRWADALLPDIDVRVVQLAGRGVVTDLWGAVKDAADGPFALFGHSFGGLLAFELAHEIRRRTGKEPMRLFVSASAAPQARQLHSPLADLPDADFVAEIAVRYGGIPAAILQDADFLAMILPALRADFRMLEQYRCAARNILTCPISVFGGRLDGIVSASSLDGWADHTAGSFSRDVIDGDHFYLQSQRLVLADKIKHKLELDRVSHRERSANAVVETIAF
jgi:medium-chain acyl-[acyl-carrier-protein] hydrolase